MDDFVVVGTVASVEAVDFWGVVFTVAVVVSTADGATDCAVAVAVIVSV